MKKELQNIIKELAEIQINAFQKLKVNPNSVDQHHLNELIEINDRDIQEVLDSRIRYWKFIQSMPEALVGISEYQWGICVHILYTMEETWVQDNVDGVNALWDLLDNMYKKFHPEIKLLWLPQRN